MHIASTQIRPQHEQSVADPHDCAALASGRPSRDLDQWFGNTERLAAGLFIPYLRDEFR